jgi:tetratricopeptide (TPR) repeat protein
MTPRPSDQLAIVISYARDFSMDNKIYYIDSMMILLMLLSISDFLMPISENDRATLMDRILWHPWTFSDRAGVRKDETIPLTIDAEDLVISANKLRKKLKHKYLLGEHVMLVLLSVQGAPRNQLERAGLIFEEYKEELERRWQTKVNIDIGSVARKPGKKRPHEKLLLYLYGKQQKKQLAVAHLREANYFFRHNQLRLARNYCWYALQVSPGNADAYGLCAAAWIQERAFEKAYPLLKDALILEPDNKYLKLDLATCLREMGEMEQADIIYQQLVAHHSNDLHVLNNIGFFYADTERYEDAITFLDKAIAIDDDEYNAFAYNNKGYALMELGQLEAAREHILKSLALHKGNSYAYRNLALLHLKENNQAAAKEALLQSKRFRFTAMYGPEVEVLLAGMA